MAQYVFFYDHTVLKGNEETDPDPTEAIRFFYPPNIPLQEQHDLCSQLMGVSKLLQHLFQSRPALFHLAQPSPGHSENSLAAQQQRSRANPPGDTASHSAAGGVVACIHTPCNRYTFAFYSLDQQIGSDCVVRQAKALYNLIMFFNGCPDCLFGLEEDTNMEIKQKTEPVTILSASVARYLAYVTSGGNTLLAIFEPVPNYPIYCSLLYQSVSNLLDNCAGWPHVLSGCIFYHEKLLMSHLPLSIVSRISLIKQRHIEFADNYADFIRQAVIPPAHLPSNFRLAPGVALLRCRIPKEELSQLNFHCGTEDNHVTYSTEKISANNISSPPPPAIVRDHTCAAMSANQEASSSTPNTTKFCCNEAGFVSYILYIVAKSDIFLALILDDLPRVRESDYLTSLHRLCLPAIGELEFSLLRQTHQTPNPSATNCAPVENNDASIPVGALVFDPLDKSLSVNLGVKSVQEDANSVGRRPANPKTYWQEQLVGCAGRIHDEMLRDNSLRHIVLGGNTGWFSAKRRAGRELYESRELREKDLQTKPKSNNK